MQLCQIPVGWV